MITELEERLRAGDSDFATQLRDKLEKAEVDCRRRLSKGSGPQYYQRWQMEARALGAGIVILNTLEGK